MEETRKLKTEDVETLTASDLPKNRNSTLCYYIILMTHVTLFLQLGILTTSLNPATPALRRFFNKTYTDRYSEAASDSTITLLITLTLCMLLAGAILGSVATMCFAMRTSRRCALIWFHVLTLLSIVLMSPITYYTGSYEAIIVGRFINGFARGFGMNIVTLYVTETSCRENMSLSQSPPGWLVPLGFVIGTVTGHPKVLGSDSLWPVLVAYPGLLSVYYLANAYWVPITPAYHLRRNDGSKAYSSLRKLRGSNKAVVDAEFQEMSKQLIQGSEQSMISFGELLCNPVYRRQLFTACVILANFQTIGFIVVMLYSDSMFIAAGMPADKATFPSIGVCVETVLVALVGSFMIQKFDIRRLLISGNCIIVVSCIVLSLSQSLRHIHTAMPYVYIAATFVYIFGVGTGPMLVSFPMMVQSINKFPEARAPILIVAGTMFWVAGAAVGFSAPYLFKAFDGFAWLVYALITTLVTVYFIYVLKPTR